MAIINSDKNDNTNAFLCVRYYSKCQMSLQWGCSRVLQTVILNFYFLYSVFLFSCNAISSFSTIWHFICPCVLVYCLFLWLESNFHGGKYYCLFCSLLFSLELKTLPGICLMFKKHLLNKWMDIIHLFLTVFLWNRYCFPYFSGEQISTERLSNLPEIM